VGVTGLAAFNALDDAAVRRRLAECCTSPGWVAAVAGKRPYAGVDELLAASDAAVAALSEEELAAALAGHPRIGERQDAGSWSGQEQAGVASAADQVRRALADGNAAYEQRFGHIYLVCATGRSGAELLDLLHQRLGNDDGAEWQVVGAELARINQIRLRKLLGAAA